MAYALSTIANAFIRMARKQECNDLTPMKLLKLMYIAHGWSLGLFNRPLFVEEVEAWKYGPVIRELYHEVKRYRNRPIDQTLSAPDESIEDMDEMLLEQVWNAYGHYDGLALSSITHRPNSPWSETWDERGMHGLTIPTPRIREHYQSLATAGRERQQQEPEHAGV
ncbi:type II toxin-antitoxin system antitoxin SocA domain-containing protein [Halomonas sp.]|uniref:Panacea domain-containing protein n=1 Tax=Halomonas sp. TaxID=1486246 RepID=UPI000C912F04|nr:type II toxin-antitoxin system antitoxin SocA domain-containing protein [Halomonas sp.]MAR73670.1 hypothetical protein [Halomonas sp.]